MAHPALGLRLIERAAAARTVGRRASHEIVGSPNDLKRHPSMTRCSPASPDTRVFDVTRMHIGGAPAPITMGVLAEG